MGGFGREYEGTNRLAINEGWVVVVAEINKSDRVESRNGEKLTPLGKSHPIGLIIVVFFPIPRHFLLNFATRTSKISRMEDKVQCPQMG